MAKWSLLKKFLTLCGFSSESSTQQIDSDSETTPKFNELKELDRITRFVTDRDHYKPTKPQADQLHFRAFMPSPKDPNELSTADIAGLADPAVWQLGDDMITAASGRPVIARGDLTIRQVGEVAVTGHGPLAVKRNEPPERHTLIVGWPALADGDARKSFAQQLRQAARAVGR